MVRVRAIVDVPAVWLLAMMSGLGILSAFVTQRFGLLAAAMLVLLVPFLVFVLPLALGQAARNFGALRKQLTWWHGLWLLVFLSGLVFRMRDTQTIREAPIDFWAAYRITFVCITAVGLTAWLALGRTEWISSLFRGLVGALAIFSLISVASTIWSVYPAWTLYKSLEYLVDVALLGAILATIRSAEAYRSLFDWTWLMLGGLLVTVWAGAILRPEQAFTPGGELLPWRISGVLPALDQNSVGEYAAVLAIVALTRLLFLTRESRGRAFYWGLLAFGLVTLVLSQTRAAIVGFLLGIVVAVFFSKRLGLIVLLLLTVILPLSLTSTGHLLRDFWQRGESPEGLETLSGRLPVWESAWEKFQQRPLAGYGAYAGERFTVLAEDSYGHTLWSSTLNSYVDVIVGTGVWGLVPVLVALLATWWVLIRMLAGSWSSRFERQLALEAAGVLAVVMTRSLFSPNLVSHPALTFLLVVGYAELLRRNHKYQTAAPA